MRRRALLLIAALLLCGLGGCTPTPAPTPEPDKTAGRRIGYEEDISAYLAGNVTDTMLALPRFASEIDGEPVSVILYIDANLDGDGQIAWNDGQLHTLLVQRGSGGYPIVAREYIQGTLDCTVIQNHDDDSFSLLVTYKASAGIIIYEYTYDAEVDSFIEHAVYETAGNVSVIG